MKGIQDAAKQGASNLDSGAKKLGNTGKQVVEGTVETGQKVGKGVMDVASTGFKKVKSIGEDAADAAQSAIGKLVRATGLTTGGRRSRRRSKSRKSRHNRRHTRHSRRRRSSSRRRRSHTRRRR